MGAMAATEQRLRDEQDYKAEGRAQQQEIARSTAITLVWRPTTLIRKPMQNGVYVGSMTCGRLEPCTQGQCIILC